MTSMYPFQVSIIWLFLIAFYYLFLGNVTFFKSNRYYLLVALCLGLIVPVIQPYLIQNQIVIEPILLPTITISSQMTALESTNESITSYNWILILYWVGVVFMSMRFMKGMIGIIWLINGNKKEKINNFTLVHLDKEMSPFSFFNYIFIYQKGGLTQEEWEQIYIHESTHSKQFHSIDILFTEILKIFFWWNPFLYAFQKALQEVHEYEADNTVKNIKNTKQYGLLLMKQSLSGNHAALSNGFINSQLKKRIMMMTKKRSSQLTKMRYIWSLPLLVLLALVTFGDELDAQTSVKGKPVAAKIGIDTITIFDPVTFKETVEIVEFTIWENHDLDNIAILKGCQDLETEIEQSNCSNQRLLKTLYANIVYPEEAIMKKKEGEVIVRINIKNKKANYKILEDPGYGMGAAVLVALLRSDFEWIPAEHEGRSVPTLFNLPVKFVLGDNIQTERKDLNNAIKNVVMNFKNDKLEVRFSNPTARKFMMQLYDTKGNLKSYSANSKEILWAKSESKEVIVVLSDKAGHRVVRRVKQQ